MEHSIICISCPIGCHMTVTQSDAGEWSVTGNACNRGKTYGIAECTHPVRIVTSLVLVDGTTRPIAVKTREGIPKEKIFEVLGAIRQAIATPPIRLGDVIVADVCQTGVDVIATSESA